MVRVTLFFIGGIFVGISTPEFLSEQTTYAIAFSLFAIYLLLYFGFPKTKIFSLLSGSVGLALIFVFGYLVLLQNNESRKSNHLINFKDPIEAYEAVVKSTPELKEKSWRIEVQVLRVKSKSWHSVSGNVLLYIARKSDSLNILYDDVLLIKGTPPEIQAPGNPHEFNFKRFLSFKKIYHQQFVQPEAVKLVHHTESKSLFYYASLARQGASAIMKKHLTGKKEQAIALALVLGVNDGLDNDLQNAYSASGAMHVLSVSGLHVAILYAMILLILKPIKSLAWGKWPIAIISLVALWAYAFVTGLSPSVLRAVTMFTFIALAKPFGRGSNIYNTLAVSAFVLLMFNPYLIMSVGFQLSYLAVLGIVYLQAPIYNLWSPRNKILDWVWQITCVSIAAQLATFSLGLLYFHQFPVYFLFSNLVVIPGSFAVLILGIILLVINWLTPVATVVGVLLDYSIKILNESVFIVEDLPYSLINGVYFTTLQCWMLMAIVVAFIFLFEKKTFEWVIVALVLSVFFSGSAWLHFHENVNSKYIIVYRVPGHTAVEFIKQGQSIFLSDSILVKDQERIRFHIRPTRLFAGVTSTRNENTSVHSKGGFDYFVWNSKKVLWVKNKKANFPKNLAVDYLIISNNALSFSSLKTLSFEKLIFDSSNSKAYLNKFKFQNANQMKIHSVSDQGAFFEKINL
jgi:competence protein ComEC